MDYTINKLKVKSTSGVFKHNRTFKKTNRWMENMSSNNLKSIQDEIEHIHEKASVSEPREADARNENDNPNVPIENEISYVIHNQNKAIRDSNACDAVNSDSYASSSEYSEEDAEIYQIRDWAVMNNVSDEQVDGLLQILRRRLLPNAPLSADALLKINSASPFTSSRNAQSQQVPSIASDAVSHEQDFRVFLMRHIVQINSDVAELKGKAFANNTIYTMSQTEFSEKYKIRLPMETVSEFEDFNRNIMTHQHFYLDVNTLLKTTVVFKDKICRMIAPLLKIFLTRELALYCITVQIVENRIELTDTAFSKCLKLVIFERRQTHAAETTDTDYNNALHSTITNSKHWNGHHYQRSRISPMPLPIHLPLPYNNVPYPWI